LYHRSKVELAEAQRRASEAYTLLGSMERELKEVQQREMLLVEALQRQEMPGPPAVAAKKTGALCRALLHVVLHHSSRQRVRGLALRVLSNWRLRQYCAKVCREKEREAHVVVCGVLTLEDRLKKMRVLYGAQLLKYTLFRVTRCTLARMVWRWRSDAVHGIATQVLEAVKEMFDDKLHEVEEKLFAMEISRGLIEGGATDRVLAMTVGEDSLRLRWSQLIWRQWGLMQGKLHMAQVRRVVRGLTLNANAAQMVDMAQEVVEARRGQGMLRLVQVVAAFGTQRLHGLISGWRSRAHRGMVRMLLLDIEAAEHTLHIQLAWQGDQLRASRLRSILRGHENAVRLEARQSLATALGSMVRKMRLELRDASMGELDTMKEMRETLRSLRVALEVSQETRDQKLREEKCSVAVRLVHQLAWLEGRLTAMTALHVWRSAQQACDLSAEKERVAGLDRKLDRVGLLTSQIASSSQEQLILQKSAASLAQAAGFLWYINMIFRKHLGILIVRMLGRWWRMAKLEVSPPKKQEDDDIAVFPVDPPPAVSAMCSDSRGAASESRDRANTEPGLFTASMEDLFCRSPPPPPTPGPHLD